MDDKALLAMNLSDVNFIDDGGKDVNFLAELNKFSSGALPSSKAYTLPGAGDAYDHEGNRLFKQETTNWGTLDRTLFNFCPNNYIGYSNYNDTFGRAFKLAAVLMEKKLVKNPKTVQDFIKLVKAIEGEL